MGLFSKLGGAGSTIAGLSTFGLVGNVPDPIQRALGFKAPTAPRSPAQAEAEQILLRAAKGKREGPSVAELQLQKAQRDAQRKLMGALSAQRTRNVGLARREAVQAGGRILEDVGSQAAILRAQEEAADERRRLQAAQAIIGGGTEQQKLALQAQQIQTENIGRVLGGAGQVGAAAAGAALSDESCKTDKKKGKDRIQKFLDSLEGMSYNYKEDTGENPKDENIGVMAQDLEKTPEGKAMVVEDAEGNKQINFGKGFNALLASMTQINDRMKKIEDGKELEKIVKKIMKKKGK